MLGVQILILSLFMFLIGAEFAAPGVTRSAAIAAASVTISAQEHTYQRLCERVRLEGGVCAPHSG